MAKEKEEKTYAPGTRMETIQLKRGRVHEITVFADGSFTVVDVRPVPEPE
jgi:hypothetical protein